MLADLKFEISTLQKSVYNIEKLLNAFVTQDRDISQDDIVKQLPLDSVNAVNNFNIEIENVEEKFKRLVSNAFLNLFYQFAIEHFIYRFTYYHCWGVKHCKKLSTRL